jgi:hypothetical protein
MPINKTAAIVISKGFEYKSKIKNLNNESKNPLEIKLPTTKNKNNKNFIDFTGFRFARFTVIGMSTAPYRWVVRCDCGVYCIRKRRAINNPENVQDRCLECKHLAHIKKRYSYIATGRNQDIRNF